MPRRSAAAVGGILAKELYTAIILYLDEVGEANVRMLCEIGNHYKVSAQARELQRLGLVKVRKEVIPRHAWYFSLTERGTALASKLKEAKAIIESV